MTGRYSIAVDPANPGEFFACCGLLELSTRITGYTVGFFSDRSFELRGPAPPLELLRELATCRFEELGHLSAIPVKPLIAPLRLEFSSGAMLTLDAWVTLKREKGELVAAANRPWNFWSGQQTSFRIWTSLQAALRQQLHGLEEGGPVYIFRHRVPLSGRFGFDPGAAWNALDTGFSPNEQSLGVASSPAVELLAAVGLQRFRPPISSNAESFTYCTWDGPLPVSVGAAAVAGALHGVGARCFRAPVVSRGSYAALGYSTPLPGDGHEQDLDVRRVVR